MEEKMTGKRTVKSETKNKIVNKIIASKNFSLQVKKLSRQFDEQKSRIMKILSEKYPHKTETARLKHRAIVRKFGSKI